MRRLVGVLCVLAAPAAACGVGEQEVFDCTASGGTKLLRVCTTEEAARYSFGRLGQQPELELFAEMQALDYRPWNGIGRSYYEQVTFYNAGHAYTVYFNLDRLEEDPLRSITGGVAVNRNGEEIANVSCDPGSITNGLDALYGQKQAVGQCWDHSNFLWTTNCPPS